MANTQDTKRILTMKFDPLIIDDLGAKLYSTLPPIISELIANGYDACAHNVWIELFGDDKDKSIIIRDDGIGMSFDDVDDKYLLIGRKRREEKKDSKCDRLPIGKKGLGKLAFFGVAKNALIETVKDNTKIIFEMDWKKIQDSKKLYEPKFTITERVADNNGTKITLSGIYRKTDFDEESLRRSISNYFIFDKDFKVYLKKNDNKFKEINNELRYEQPGRKKDFVWPFPDAAKKKGLDKKFPFVKSIKGEIILFDKPVRNKLRGVTLFSRHKLVNLPEFFPVQGSSFFFQYLTGWLEVDFIDDFKPDVISTNRSRLAWTDDNLEELKKFLNEIISFIHGDWRVRKQKRTDKKIKETYNIDPAVWKETNKHNSVILENIRKVEKILDDPEKVDEVETVNILGIVYSLAPENADFVLWTGLHKKITDNVIIKEKFFTEKYLEAAREAVQIYNEEVQTVSGEDQIDYFDLVSRVFGKDKEKPIWLTNKSNESEKDIDEGHKFLSMGIMTGFRNPALGHTSLTKAEKIKYFSDRNCLDILSIISYLFDRLEKRMKP